MTTRHAHRLTTALGAAALVASLLVTGSAAADNSDGDNAAAARFSFQKISFPTDPKFTQLLGINDHKVIAGYHGDLNAEMTPNMGVMLKLPGKFSDENFPNSAQTQVVGINNNDDTVGFYIDQQGNTHGFQKQNGKGAATVDHPDTTFNQLLGINNKGQAAGYFQDAAGLQHAYVHEKNGKFTVLNIPLPSSQATSVNDKGTVVGFEQASPAATTASGFMLKGEDLTVLNYPGAVFTEALGVNNSDEVVGFYNDANNVTHGFIYHNDNFETIDVDGSTATTINGINRNDDFVGFFVDANNNTVGVVGKPKG